MRVIKIVIFLLYVYVSHLSLLGNDNTSVTDIDAVKKDPTFNKSINGFTLSLTPDQMKYLLDYLPHASCLLNEYGIHTLRISFLGNKEFHAEDDSGLEGTFSLIDDGIWYREYAGKGWIKSRAITTISADVVATISFKEASQGQIVNDLEFWVKVDSVILDFLCKLFRPILLQILTNKFDHFVQVAQSFVVKIQEDPEEAAELLQRRGLSELEVEEFRRAFCSNE